MRLLIITILALFFGVAAKAQTAVANLSITLTDIQSVKIPQTVTEADAQKDQNSGSVEMLSPSTSQVRVYSSHNSDIEKLNKDFYTSEKRNSSIISYASNHPKYARAQNGGHKRDLNASPQLLVYQIDPR